MTPGVIMFDHERQSSIVELSLPEGANFIAGSPTTNEQQLRTWWMVDKDAAIVRYKVVLGINEHLPELPENTRLEPLGMVLFNGGVSVMTISVPVTKGRPKKEKS